MKIGIIGGGSIGLLISSYVSLKHRITIYVQRKSQKLKINSNGLLLDQTKDMKVKALLMNELKNEDCFIICVKQTQLTSVMPYLQTIKDHIPLIFIQNGMGHIELIKSLKNPLYVGVVEHGAMRISDHQVVHTGKGLIRLATLQGNDERLKDLVEKMSLPQFPIKKAANWQQLLSKKLMINAVINPLTTLFGVKNRQIIENPYITFLAKQLCKETATILNLNENNEWKRVKEIARSTGNNSSSMLVDLHNKRKTELEAITGYLLHKSKGEVPYTTFIYNSIKALEVKNGID